MSRHWHADSFQLKKVSVTKLVPSVMFNVLPSGIETLEKEIYRDCP